MPAVMKQTEISEQVVEIEIERLKPFKGHPFKVREDNDMKALKDSIRQYGIMSPLIVRPMPDVCYEIISGHRRKYAASRLGYRKVPVIIRVMKDDDSIISMVDSNLQRDKISFSEKAFAYKMKNDAMKRMHLGTYIEEDSTERRIRTIQAISGLTPDGIDRSHHPGKDRIKSRDHGAAQCTGEEVELKKWKPII